MEKLVEWKMMEEGTNQRIMSVDRHAGMAAAGWKPDARQFVHKARSEAKDYLAFYGSRVPGHVLCERLSAHAHMNTMYWHLRPYGCSALLAVYDEKGAPNLWLIEPSGKSWVSGVCVANELWCVVKN